MRQTVRVLMGLLVLAVLAGCGPKRSRFGEVTGKVTYKSQPVNDAALLLYPAAGGPDALPLTIPVDGEGNFRIRDVTPGEYRVVVQGQTGENSDASLLKMLPPDKRAEMKAKMGSPATAKTIPFPKKYQNVKSTPLKCTVSNEDQSLNLELTD
jgi:hypothetical protein